MVSQSTNINTVKADENTLPQQMTYDGQTLTGAQKTAVIGATDEGIEGVEVYRPTETVNVTKVYDDISDVSKSYRETLRSLQNTVNEAQWPENSEFNAGELLFLGADISYNIEENSVTVNYSFQAGARIREQKFEVWKDDATLEDQTAEVTVYKYYPFQHLYASPDTRTFNAGEGADAKSVAVTRSKSINVADVYAYGDFSQLKIAGD